MNKGIDRTFLEYGIRRDDLNAIVALCEQHGLDPEWVKENILKKYHESKVDSIELKDSTVEKIIDRALQKLV